MKKNRLKGISILILCFLVCGMFHIEASAEETETIPQFEFTKAPNTLLLADKYTSTMQYKVNHLSQADFEEKNTISEEEIDDFETTVATRMNNKNYINAGELIATLPEGEDVHISNINYGFADEDGSWFGAADAGEADWNVPEIALRTTEGNINWQPSFWAAIGDPSTIRFAGITAEDICGLWGILEYQEKEYLFHFDTKVICTDYICAGSGTEAVSIKLSTYDSGKNKYEVASNFALSSPSSRRWEDNTYIIDIDKRDGNDGWAKVNTIIPRYAYGATGTDAVLVQNVGEDVQGFVSEVALAKRDTPYSFWVRNSKGEKKEYKVVINMPWYVKSMLSADKYTPILSEENEEGTHVLDGNLEVQSGKKMTLSINLKGEEAGKKITGVKILTGDTWSGSIVPCEIKNNTVYFTMPKDDITIWSVTTVAADTEDYAINTEVAVEGSTESCSGLVQVLNEDGNSIATANEGVKVTIKAIKQDNYKSIYDWKFDHWEAGDLIPGEKKNDPEVQITMPDHAISVKAVYVRCGEKITVGTTQEQGGKIRLTSTNNGNIMVNQESFTDVYKTGIKYEVDLENPYFEGYEFLGWKDGKGNYYDTSVNNEEITWKKHVVGSASYMAPEFTLVSGASRTFIADFRAKKAGILTLTTNDDKQGTVSAKVGEKAIVSGETVLYDGQTISLTAEAKKSYRFKEWKVTEPASESGVTFEPKTASTTTFVMPAKQALTIQAVFEPDPDYQSEECTLTDVKLLKSDGTLVKKANKETVNNVTTFTVQLTPNEMTKDESLKLTSGTYKLCLTYSDKAKAKMEDGHEDDATGTWSDGISNPISVGATKTFTITAQNPKFHQDYKVAIVYDDRPLLTAGAVNRLSDTEATVDFTSSSAGSYYYAVVEKGAAEPTIDTSGVGVAVKANKAVTISLKSLTAGAKDIYIKVKNDDKYSDVKISDTLKITIPDYDPDKTGYTIETPQSPGGTISVDKKVAKEGELVTVTVTPDAGKQIKPDGLRYSQSGPPYEVVKIDTKTKQFKMPAYNISVSCTFVNADTVTTDGPTIGAFIVNGVSGVINDTTGTITITLPYGTDLTALKPALTLKGAVSVSPASGATVNLSSSKTYTVTAEDGTTKTYTVTAYTEAQPTSDKLWEDMLNHIGGNTGNTGKNTWWQKAKDMKKNNNYPKYW